MLLHVVGVSADDNLMLLTRKATAINTHSRHTCTFVRSKQRRATSPPASTLRVSLEPLPTLGKRVFSGRRCACQPIAGAASVPRDRYDHWVACVSSSRSAFLRGTHVIACWPKCISIKIETAPTIARMRLGAPGSRNHDTSFVSQQQSLLPTFTAITVAAYSSLSPAHHGSLRSPPV